VRTIDNLHGRTVHRNGREFPNFGEHSDMVGIDFLATPQRRPNRNEFYPNLFNWRS
jgi:hypothetical protein